MYQVIVGNIGTVIETTERETAQWTFEEYATMSRNGYGRAAGEPVTMMENGEIILEYTPPMPRDVQEEYNELPHLLAAGNV